MDPKIIPITKYSYREYQLFPDDGMRHEIADGDHFMSPAPSTKHQTVSRRIQFQLYAQIELKGLGQVFDAPTDVELSLHDIVQPDLLVVLQKNLRIVSTKRIRGVPDLIIEILSDSNPDYDRVLKLEMYQRVGVPEYWIVDPEEEFVEAYVLAEGRLKLVNTYRETIQVATMSGIKVDLNQVWGK
jgi:Uma2 family endonuclease